MDNGLAKSRIIFVFVFLASLSGLIHVFIKGSIVEDRGAFVGIAQIFNYSIDHIFSSGVIGGLFCECIYTTDKV